MLVLYAVSHAAPDLTRTLPERLVAHQVGPLALVHERSPSRPERSSAQVIRFARLVTSVWERTRPMLPARFGSVVTDHAELDSLADQRGEALLARLGAVRG